MAWGIRLCVRVRALGAALVWPLLTLGSLGSAGCGSGDGKHSAVECRLDEDCIADDLGVCDVATCVDGRCKLDSQPDGHRCDDSDPLTGEDACLSGICAGVLKTCEDDLGPCLKAVYDKKADECVVEPVEDGAPCDDEDACTQLDSCQAGECVGDEPKTCEAADDCHVSGECDPETGECSEVKAEDGVECDDGLLCTSDDTCSDGACSGTELACDDGLTCSVDSCDEASGSCAADVSQCSCATDQDCSDGNLCNGVEHCDQTSKLCQAGTPAVCANSTDPCLRNVCVAATGACEPEPTPNGTRCDDGSACTSNEACQDGVCGGGDAVVCTALSQCHVAGTCDPLTGECDNPQKPAGSSCNDGDGCTASDTCQAGQCLGAGLTTCPPSDQCHEAGACNPQTGACSNPAKPDGVGCDDADKCSSGDACQAGVCAAGTRTTCAALDDCHAAGSCDPSTGDCTNPAKPDGSQCNDNSVCTTVDTCTGGKCGGPAPSCDDGVACSVDSCSDQLGGCSNDRSKCPCTTNQECNDGNPCNGVETCDLQNSQCVAGVAVNCSAFDNACNLGVCSPATGTCSASPKPNGSACDDSDACTPASSCQAGVCQGANRKLCTASDQCHDAGTCNAGTGACSNPAKGNGASCDDNDKCTQASSCQAGRCLGSNPVTCTAMDACHDAGTCNPGSGMCSNPPKGDGASCDDNSKCSRTDKCQAGRCIGGNLVVCTPSDSCHDAGVCAPGSGMCSNPAKADGAGCDDKSKCTPTDTCLAGTCVGSGAPTCTPRGTCYLGLCDPDTGSCVNQVKDSGSSCDDASVCTTGETCDGKGTCAGGTVTQCPAAPQCKASTCDSVKGCGFSNQPNGTLCDDGKVCTRDDQCGRGACGGTVRDNATSDWADDPGNAASSVDTFTTVDGDAAIVGAYSSTIYFNDKNNQDPNRTKLDLPANAKASVYWAVYKQLGGAIVRANAIVGGSGTVSVSHVAVDPKGNFSVLGTVYGDMVFGLDGKAGVTVAAKETEVYVAHYLPDGTCKWVAEFVVGQSAYTADSIAAYDDGSVIAIGSVNGSIKFRNAKGEEFASGDGQGVWAARLGEDGGSGWGNLVVRPGTRISSSSAQAVTALDDGGAALTGGFGGVAVLGPTSTLSVSVQAKETGGRDVWFQKLDGQGNLKWGGRVGGVGADVPGDVARAKDGGALLLANVLGAEPNANDSGTTQPLLFASSTGVMQVHVLGLDSAGFLKSDGLIADKNGKGATRGYQVKLDSAGKYAVVGHFQSATNLWSGLGFGGGTLPTETFSLARAHGGVPTLFVARADQSSAFEWAIQAGGDGSGLGNWDVVATGHGLNHAVTIAGMFRTAATFGDDLQLKTEALTPDVDLGSPFVVHVNSEGEYDFICK